MAKNEITGRQAEQRQRVGACKARIVELVANEGAAGISTEDLRGSLVRWRRADIDNAIREVVAEGAIVRGERDGSGGFRYRSPRCGEDARECRAGAGRSRCGHAKGGSMSAQESWMPVKGCSWTHQHPIEVASLEGKLAAPVEPQAEPDSGGETGWRGSGETDDRDREAVRAADVLRSHPALLEIGAERDRQIARWGSAAPSGGFGGPVLMADLVEVEAAKRRCELAAKEHRCTMRHVLEEEVAEVFAENPGSAKQRAELVQVAAVCVKWIELIDRDGAK